VGPDGGLYYVAIGAGEVRRIVQGAAPAPSDACSLRLGAAAASWLRHAAPAVGACARRGRSPCAPTAAALAMLARVLARRCAAPALDLCARLECASCTGATDLAACAGRAAVLGELATRALAGGPGRCAAAVVRAGAAHAAARAAAITRCRRRGVRGCSPERRALDARLARRIASGCGIPAPLLCEAFDCVPCTSGRELAACVADAVATAVDTFAFQVSGAG
jgi:hypothetical protein